MKNLQIGYNDLIGNRFNGHDLHNYLLSKNIDSKHLVWIKSSHDPNTFEIDGRLYNRFELNHIIQDIENKFSCQSMFYPFSYELLFNRLFLDADIIHYHLIHSNFFNISHLPILSQLKPSVWTLHDPWAATGHCIYPGDCNRWKTGCGDCSYQNRHFAIKNDTSSLNWEIKKNIFQNSEFDLIVASQWMVNLVKQSPLLSRFNTHLIPFGINLNIFKPIDAIEVKKKLNIPKNTIVLCFRATDNQFKGVQCIKKFLNNLRTEISICLLTLQEKGMFDEFKHKYQVIDMGWINDENELVNVYNVADIFLMPSTEEAFGMMAIESMACGKPSVVFDGTALPNTIFAPKGGISVPKNDFDSFMFETKELIENTNKRKIIGQEALKLAKENYNADSYVKKIIDLYNNILDKKKNNEKSIYLINQLKNISINIKNEQESEIKKENIITKEQEVYYIFNLIFNIRFFKLFILKILIPILKFFIKIFKKNNI